MSKASFVGELRYLSLIVVELINRQDLVCLVEPKILEDQELEEEVRMLNFNLI